MRRTALLCLTAVLGAGLVLLPAAPGAAATPAEVAQRPADGVFLLQGHGWGHGRGMSQWGAQGAASLGRTVDEITSTYYPGTARAVLPDRPIRVWLSGDEGRDTVVAAAADLRATDVATGASTVLPATAARWRVVPDGDGLQLQSLIGTTWSPYALGGRTSSAGPVRFSGPALTRVVFPDGASRDYRGSVSAVRRRSGLVTVVTLGLEDYLLGVVPREVSAGWRPAALQAQAIAARSYSAYKRDRVRTDALYDICDTTACQVFGGTRVVSASGRVTELEPASTSDAVRATRGVVRTWQGRPVLAEFSSSNGGHSTAGHVPYLTAGPDPWDGVVPNTVHAWTARLPAGALERRFPALGTLLRLRVTARDGNGAWGGRVRSVVLEGSHGSVTTTGASVYAAAAWPGTSGGPRSSWWRVVPTTPDTDAALVALSAAPTLVRPPGTSTAVVTATLRNTGRTTWPVAGLHLAGTGAGALTGARPGVLVSRTTAGSPGVAPGETAVFRVALDAARAAAGTHLPTLRLRLGSGLLVGPAVTWRVPVAPARLTAARAGTGPAAARLTGDAPGSLLADGRTVVLPRGGSATVRLAFRNTGNVAWPGDGSVLLGTSGPRNRPSASSGSSWRSPSRTAPLRSAVPVGGTGTAELVLHGAGRPVGVSTEAFEPAWSGRAWLQGAATGLTVVRVDPRVPRLAALHSAPLRQRVATGRSTTLVVRLRNVGGAAWTVGREALAASSPEPLRTAAWTSPTRPPALAGNASRLGARTVQPGEIGEWRVPLAGRRVGAFRTVLTATGPAGRFGPALATTTTVTPAR